MARSVPWRRQCNDLVNWRQTQAQNATIYILRETGPTGFLLKEEGETKPCKVNMSLKCYRKINCQILKSPSISICSHLKHCLVHVFFIFCCYFFNVLLEKFKYASSELDIGSCKRMDISNMYVLLLCRSFWVTHIAAPAHSLWRTGTYVNIYVGCCWRSFVFHRLMLVSESHLLYFYIIR